MLSRTRAFASVGVLALLAAYVTLVPPQRATATRLDRIPASVLGFPGTDLSLDQAVLDDLDPDALVCREYRRPDGLPIWLIIVYFENARLGAHDPLLCYRSQGFVIEEMPQRTVPSAIGPVPLPSFRASRGARIERVSYFWYTAGQQTLAEVKTFRDAMFWQGMLHNRSFGAFVRISTIESGPENEDALLDRFVAQLAPALPGAFPEN